MLKRFPAKSQCGAGAAGVASAGAGVCEAEEGPDGARAAGTGVARAPKRRRAAAPGAAGCQAERAAAAAPYAVW